jgi:hypothetical protein
LEPSFKAAMNPGGSAAVQVQLVTSPKGSVVHCARAFANGPASNGDAFCSMLRTRNRYTPARDSSGQPAFGVTYLWSHWTKGKWTGSDVPSWNSPDLSLTVNQMPGGFDEGSLFRLALQVNAAGAVEACAAAMPGLAPPVTEFLCREAASGPVAPATDDQGRAVARVQEYLVRLTSKAHIDKVVKRIKRLERR